MVSNSMCGLNLKCTNLGKLLGELSFVSAFVIKGSDAMVGWTKALPQKHLKKLVGA